MSSERKSREGDRKHSEDHRARKKWSKKLHEKINNARKTFKDDQYVVKVLNTREYLARDVIRIR